MKQISHQLFFFCFILFACGQNSQLQNHPPLTPQLIQACIDSTLALDPGLNTGTFLLDIRLIDSIDRKASEGFKLLNRNITFVNSDSLIAVDSTWIKYQFFQNPVIRFEKIDFKNDRVIISTSKTRASDGSIVTIMIFRRIGNRYECLESRITKIS